MTEEARWHACSDVKGCHFVYLMWRYPCDEHSYRMQHWPNEMPGYTVNECKERCS